MSMRDIGPLHAADEGLNHQIADTFATIAESDRSWTEKIWASIDPRSLVGRAPGGRRDAGGPDPGPRDDEHLRLLGQFRDTPVRVREEDAEGYGILESIISGVWPDLGLTAESDHPVSYT